MRDRFDVQGAASTAPSVYFETLGCAKNEVDTRDMQDALRASGFTIAGSIDACDAVVINTCSFIRPAIEESIDAFFELSDAERIRDEGIPVIVAGCLPARFGDELSDALPEAAALVPCAEEDGLAEVIANLLAGMPEREGSPSQLSAGEDGLGDGEGGYFAYVKISDGCDRFCSYCTIPYIRGRYHSFAYEQIEAEARKAIGQGAREIVLIGQDTGLWGSDFDEPSDLPTLLESLATRFPDCWFRAMYTQPENVTQRLFEVMASHDNVAPYLDIPMQHVVPRILEAMNRTGSRDEFMAMIGQARSMVPGIAIRTTLIAGFPGETEDDFEDLVSFVEDAELDYVGVFPYSREEGTKAFSLPEQIDEDEKQYRAERLRTVADAVSSAVIAQRIGTELPVLVEGEEEDGQLVGRSIIQAPEVDGVTFVDRGEPGSQGRYTIEDTLMYDMEAVSR